jgi:hypothetical protein
MTHIDDVVDENIFKVKAMGFDAIATVNQK